jgi:hypothetical protein
MWAKLTRGGTHTHNFACRSPVVVMCGCPDVYEPPDRLSVLVQDAYDSLSQVGFTFTIWLNQGKGLRRGECPLKD